MKIYYYIQDTSHEVPAEKPMEATIVEARLILNSLHETGNFLGAELSSDRVLQFYAQEGVIWLEILHIVQQTTNGCEVTLPIADLALEAAYQGNDIPTALRDAGFDWLDWHLTKLDSIDQ